MQTMMASILRNGTFVVEQRGRPSPGSGEVLVKVHRCGICGSDLHFFRHQRDTIEKARSLGADVSELERAYSEGVVLGHEFVGEIVEFGPGTRRDLAIGDRVVSMPFVQKDGMPVLIGSNPETTGAYAQYMTLTEESVLKVDPGISSEAAAFVEPLGIAIHAVNKSGIKPGAAAAVIGAGPIGLAITAVLRQRGIKTVVAADLSPARRRLAKLMGASEAIDPAAGSAIVSAGAAAPGAPLYIFENTGAPGMLYRIVLEAPANAHVIVTGIAPGEEAFLPMVAIMKELSMSFVIYYTPGEFAHALELIAAEQFDWRSLHTGTVSLDAIPAAFADLRDPERHAKILIDPWLHAST